MRAQRGILGLAAAVVACWGCSPGSSATSVSSSTEEATVTGTVTLKGQPTGTAGRLARGVGHRRSIRAGRGDGHRREHRVGGRHVRHGRTAGGLSGHGGVYGRASGNRRGAGARWVDVRIVGGPTGDRD